MPAPSTPGWFPISTAPAAARSGSTAARSMSATCARPAAPPSSTCPIRAIPSMLARIDVPERLAFAQGAGRQRHHDRQSRKIRQIEHRRFRRRALSSTTWPRPGAPKLISQWMTPGGGVHRFDFDGRYAYISPTATGYVGNIVMILDLADPAKPVEVGRWWIPGQWEAGGENYPWRDWRRAALPPSAARRRPALCQLLASRLFHSRHLRHVEAEADLAAQHQPGFPASDPHLPADAATAEGPRHHGGGRRGCGEAAAGAASLRLGLRHHRRDPAAADRDLPGARPRRRRQRRNRR